MKDILKHPTISGIIGTVVGTIIVTPVIAYMNKINLIEAFMLIYHGLKNSLISLLTYQVSFWIILLVLFTFIGIRKIVQILNENNPIASSINNLYRKDIIDHILWIFDWTEGYNGKIALTPESPYPICPHCMNDLVRSNRASDGYYSSYPNYFICDYCGFSHKIRKGDYHERIRREIIRRVRTGEWRKSLSEEPSSWKTRR